MAKVTDATSPKVSFKDFLENTPPGETVHIADLGGKHFYDGRGERYGKVLTPEILLHCDSETCSGLRLYSSNTDISMFKDDVKQVFLRYICKNCTPETKDFALMFGFDSNLTSGLAFKIGELPQFGPPTPARLIKLIGPQKDLFLKGRRSENQGLGIAAFAYYRRVIEDQKNRIFDEIIKVSRRLSVDQSTIDELLRGQTETQFSKAVEAVKHGIPQALLINGHNPLTLLHSALSEGLHAQTDEECLEIATSIREVMAELAERMADALKDEAKLTTAVTRLLQKKSGAKLPMSTDANSEGSQGQ